LPGLQSSTGFGFVEQIASFIELFEEVIVFSLLPLQLRGITFHAPEDIRANPVKRPGSPMHRHKIQHGAQSRFLFLDSVPSIIH
jgi:hypothetical protein